MQDSESLTVVGPAPSTSAQRAVRLRGQGLTIGDTVRVARHHVPVRLTRDPEILQRMQASFDYVHDAAARGEPIYGVTTGFGGMANVVIPQGQVCQLQEGLLRFMSVGAGRMLPAEEVRAAMLVRANSHLRGASGLRLELVDRLVRFLNEGVTPQVRELGSIGASGDLTPLTQIAGAIFGLDDHFRVELDGELIGSREALARLGLAPLRPVAKESLAMVNGTSMMTGMAALRIHDAQRLYRLALAAHAFYFQALQASNQSLHPYIHRHKPHPGQRSSAAHLLRLLRGSQLARDELDGRHDHRGSEPIQDRYSLRCAPQFLGPIEDGLAVITRQVETEMSSATDNPLIDPEVPASYHGGNFLGQYIGVAMDQLRYFLALLCQHLDAQIALLVAPEFNHGLPASLVGNRENSTNMGLKGLQICGNSIVPLLAQLGNSLADRFPTHAEQFNQNVNSQGFGSAHLARQSIELGQQYLAIALLFGIQAVELRTAAFTGQYDARATLSPATIPLYEGVRAVLDQPPTSGRPLVWDDGDQFLDDYIAALAADIAEAGGRSRLAAALDGEGSA